MAFGQVIDRVAQDGKITEDEVDGTSLQALASVTLLERWGKVRSATGSVGGNRDFLDVAGVGRVEWQFGSTDERKAAQRELVRRLKERFVFPIYRDDSQREDSPGFTDADETAARFDGEASVAEDIAQWSAESTSSAASGDSGSTTDTGSLGVVALLAGAAALAVVVLGGN